MAQSDNGHDFDLTCWYLNLRRVAELVGTEGSELRDIAAIGDMDDNLRVLATLSYFKDRLTAWMRSAAPPTLGELILNDTLREGAIFTHFSNYYFKGLPKVHQAIERGVSRPPIAEGYAKLDAFRSGLVARFRFSHEHLTSTSA